MFLFFDLSYTPLLELHLPTAYIGETQNGFLSFYKKATPQVLESLANWQLSSAEKEALALVNNPKSCYQKVYPRANRGTNPPIAFTYC